MIRTLISVTLVAAASLVLHTAHADDDASAADCLAHFTSEGNLFVGKKFSTWVEFPNVAKPDAYSRASLAVSKDGFTIVSSDKEAGILSASQSVSFGKGSTAPLLIVVEPSKATGSKLTATFRTAGGQATKTETVRMKLCEYLVAAGVPNTADATASRNR